MSLKWLLSLLAFAAVSGAENRQFLTDVDDAGVVHPVIPPVFLSDEASRNEEVREAPAGKNSLAFVFDVTGSMYDDLVAVREGARKIFATVLEQRQQLVHNYVLVPFHDPEVGPVVSTTDTAYFQRKLQNLYVQGGGDCPEMCISGIKLALETALPASFIYVFTDARSKDYHLTPAVLNLIQEKQSQVVFVMTGDCGNRTHPGYLAYEQIASTSNGQVFHLEKSDVKEVLNYVRIAVQTKKVNIVSINRKTGGTFLTNIPVDTHLYEFTVSVSGEMPELVLLDPEGKVMKPENGLRKVLNLGNVVLVSFPNPKSGIWTLKSTTKSAHMLRVTGIGAVDFNYGFNAKIVDDITKTHQRPLIGVMTYLMVNMTGLNAPGVATNLELVDLAGNPVFSQPLMASSNDPYMYSVGPFVPPDGVYFVKVNGMDDRNHEFQRISPTAVSPAAASGPRVYMAAKSVAYRGKGINLTCEVVSRAPYTVYWRRGTDRIGGPLFFKDTESIVWSLPQVDSRNTGHYTCEVISTSGNASATTELQTMEPLPDVTTVKNVTVSVHNTAFLTCRTQAQGRIAISWRRKDVPIIRTQNVIEYPNGTLKIVDVSKSDEGMYVCAVSNQAGTVHADTFLKVLDPPRVTVAPASFFFVERGNFNISCAVSGNPQPQVQWHHNGRRIRPGQQYYISFKHDLIVSQAGPQDAGDYECRGVSAAGSATGASNARMAVLPHVTVSQSREMIGRGDPVTLVCQAVAGSPPPKLTWYKGEREIHAFAYISIQGGRLTISGAQDADAGTYTCVATNIAGQAKASATVDVGSIPSIVPSPETVSVNIERDITFQCRATGHPKPEITWKRDGTPVVMNEHLSILPDGGLLLKNAQLDHAGRYTCTAANRFGRQDAIRTLVVTGLVSPVLGHVPPEEQILEGRSLRLSCVVVLGTPKPTLQWLKNNRPLERVGNNIILQNEGSGLLIRGAHPSDEGPYTCVATNAAGNATLNVRVQVVSKPTIEEGPVDYVVNDGAKLEIVCKATGRPVPTISWSKDGRPLYLSSNTHSLEPSGSLLLYRISRNDAGTFTCTAANSAGDATRVVRVTVRVPPSIRQDETVYSMKEGGRLIFPCEASGDPQPTITWFFEGRPVVDDGRRFQVGPDGSLIVSSGKEKDSGEYRCIARNAVGQAERSITLKVHTSPRIDGSGETRIRTVKVNETVSLSCSARADPPPLRVWTYEDRPVNTHGSELRFLGDGSLQITAAQLKHEGRYTCFVSNLAGNDTINYILKVIDVPRIISDIPGTIDVVLGLKLEIPCRAVGTPIPTVHWEKDGLQVISGKEYIVDAEGTIRIDKSQLSHAGRYVCTAKNAAGSDQRLTNVVVQEPPVIQPETPTEVTSIEGESAEFRCFAKGSPLPEIQWYRRGDRILGNEAGVSVYEDRLVFSAVSKADHGPIMCKAVNPAGEDSIDVRLTVVVPPDIPDQDKIIKEDVLIGGPFSLYCPILSHPIPEITWHLNNRPVVESDPNIRLSEDKRKLHVLTARVVDAGVYKCVARNPAGESTKTFHIEVLVPPNLDESKYQRKVTVIVGDPLTLSCPVNGIPEPDISWLANGQLLKAGDPPFRGIQLSADGKQLTISSTLRDHEGAYTCLAVNKAGSLDVDIALEVISPPELGEDLLIKTVEGSTVNLNCNPKTEGLSTSITWSKEQQTLDNSFASNIQVAMEGHRVYLRRIQKNQGGVYTCVVRNSAGESRRNYRVTVLVPPKFKEKEFQQNIVIAEGNPLILICYVEGIPLPKVTWEKDGTPVASTNNANVQFSDNNQRLQLNQLTENSGPSQYTCMASNEAGSISRDFFVTIIEPPNFDGSRDRRIVEVIKGASVLLECPISRSTGDVEISWWREGQAVKDVPTVQISLDRSKLHMTKVQESEQGVYYCLAKNSAGEATREFQLVVIVPPSIIGKLVEDIEVLKGDSFNMRCDFEAEPPPTVSWMKDNRHALSEKAQLVSDNTTIFISNADLDDAGRFSCIVSNKAGRIEKIFNVKVTLAPAIQGADEEHQLEVVVQHSITLDCTVEDSSEYSIEWFRFDRPIAADETQAQVLAGGRHLHIASAKREDAGKYSCVAKNRAGSATKRFSLLVLVPPSIRGDGGSYSIPVNHSLNLDCESEGIPLPAITWTKDGSDADELVNTQILSSGQQFRITQALELHTGRYLCTATNKIGAADVGFDVDVISPPAISNNIKDTITVIVNQTAAFKCPTTDRKFISRITWLRNRQPVAERRDKFQVSQRGKAMHLLNAQLDDAGSYSCLVKNRAGETVVNFQLIVLVPPTILILEKDKNRTAAEHTSLILSCPASGLSDPIISWQKDGEKLDADSIERLIPGADVVGNQLRISRTRIEDSGRYTCTATNEAGTAEQDISVYIMTPPRIEREGIPDSTQAVLGQRATISCPAFGRPLPTVTWFRAGGPLEAAGNVHFTAGGQKLHFVRVEEDDLSRYTCVARNPAGEDKRDFTLQALVAPSISGTNVPRNIQVIVGRSTVLDCPATGSPEPTVTWLKNGQPLLNEANLNILGNGKSIQISDAQLDDSARYTCIASNPVGVVDLDLFVTVVGPPEVKGDDIEKVEVVESNSVTFDCAIQGTEPLEIVWLKDGQAIDSAASFVQLAAKGHRLHLLAAQVSDEGRYECIGRNRAGEARKTVLLTVNVVPTINETSSSPGTSSVVKNTNIKVDCVVNGRPYPEVVWLKDGEVFYPDVNSEMRIINNNQSLWFPRLLESQAGRYTCRATNKVGTAEKDFIIRLKAPPIMEQGTVTKEVKVGDYVILTCKFRGGPETEVSWLMDERPIDTSALPPTVRIDERRIEFREARLSDTNRYTCVVKNDAGEARRHFDLTVLEPPRFLVASENPPSIILGRPLILDCSVTGTPKPKLTWFKDNAELSVSEEEAEIFLNEGQQFRVNEARIEDAGRYTCIAENKAGRVEKDIIVDIQSPPTIQEAKTVIEVAENDTTTLDCLPHPTVAETSWSKNGVPVDNNRDIQVAAGGQKLHILKAQTSHAARYTCTAKNEAGEAHLDYTVIVLVPPKILGPSLTTTQAIANQSINLECRATGSPEPKIEWSHDGRPVSSSGGLELLQNGSLLRIIKVQTLHEGRFTCVARNKVGKDEADTFLQVLAPPVIEPGETEVKVIINQGRTLRCNVHGNPAPTVSWLKNGQPFDSALIHSTLRNHYVHIVEAKPTDGGRYTCVARNKAGEDRSIIGLEVLIPPVINAGERVLNVIENRSLTINCPAEGTPEPQLKWYKDGRPVDLSDAQYQTSGQKLVLVSAKPTDAGRYSCEARNEAGEADVDFVVDIYVRPRFLPMERNVKVVEGSRATLECLVEAKPPPHITWLRGGRPIDLNSANFILSPRGHRLMILSAKRTDSGSYACSAKNAAGEAEVDFNVAVLVAPYILSQIDQNPRVVVSKLATIECPVLGIPKPEVEWLKDGEQLDVEDEQFEIEDEYKLKILSATTANKGRYTCHAFNEAGSLDTDFALDVIAPPKFGAGGTTEYEVIKGQTVSMDCNVEAVPRPEISWLRGDTPVYLERNIWISADGRTLTIANSRLEDGGSYMCKATNIAGTTDVRMVLRVLVPPEIDKSNIIGNPLAIVNRTISLECPTTGIPTPTVSWLKDGQPLSRRDPRINYAPDNQTVNIVGIIEEDRGRYTCVALNKAGRAEQEFSLEVLTPPLLQQTGREKIVITEGDSLTLTCPVIAGGGSLEISWVKDDRPIDALTSPQLRIGSEGRRLHVAQSKISDGGLYACVASNRAGESQLEFQVEVNTPPEIDGSRNDPSPHVSIGGSTTLWCMVKGHPQPTVKWSKDADELTRTELTEFYNLLEDSQGLQVISARLEDSGRYSCVASNSVGTKELEINLDVWGQPEVNISGPSVARVGEAVSFQCSARGNPEPTVQVVRNGQVIIPAVGGSQVTRDGRRVDIPKMKETDVGRYTCTAKNDVGAVEAYIDLDVLVPPVIKREGVDVSPRTQSGRTVILQCEAKGKPTPTVVWHSGGAEVQTDEHFKVLGDGEFLEIKDMRETDKGVYSCIAENKAGRDQLDFNVDVFEGPSILAGAATRVTEGSVAKLVCDAKGYPAPEVVWQRNGQQLSSRNQHSLSGNELSISNVRSSDAGIYVCVAANEIGSVQQAYTLEVLVPPKITSSGPLSQDIPQGQTFRLSCTARGYPEPTKEWFKDGNLIKRKDRFAIDREGSLVVLDAQAFDSGDYRCRASNSAGEDERNYGIQVIEPPKLSGELLIVNVTQGEPATLSCEADAAITWVKNGVPVATTTNLALLDENSVLRINSAKLPDAGDYTCTAENAAGSSTKRFRLNVFSPPTITPGARVVEVNEGSKAELPCEVLGVPNPTITWTRDKESPILPESYQRETSLLFPSVKRSDMGVYTCTAKNWAGTAFKVMELVVMIPPKVHPERQNVTVNQNDTAYLACNATGIPEPTVEWYKEHPSNTKIERSEKYQFSGTTLLIRDSNARDAQHYRCVAKNRGGIHVGFRKLNVKMRNEAKTVWIECENGRPKSSRTTYIPMRGDVPSGGAPLLPWNEEITDLPENGTNGLILKCLPDRNDRSKTLRGDPERYQAPILVDAPKNVEAFEGSRLEMKCAAIGNPPPEILWFRNSRMLSNQPQTVRGESVLQLRRVSTADAGTYLCLARNEMGTARTLATLRVKGSRLVQTEGARSVQRRHLTILTCKGMQKSDVRWLKDGKVINGQDHDAQVLIDGSLAIAEPVEHLNVSKYKCLSAEDDGNVEMAQQMIEESEPRIYVDPRRLVVVPGKTAIFECSHTSNPVITQVVWYRNSVPITQSSEKISVDSNNRLVITGVTPSDAGRYDCVGSNMAGKDSDTGILVVEASGSWSEWSDWSHCSGTCAPAHKQRTRDCRDPIHEKEIEPWHCSGEAVDMEPCRNLLGCEEEPKTRESQWSDWSAWSPCSRRCGLGSRNRLRYCKVPEGVSSAMAQPCEGKSSHLESCSGTGCRETFPDGSTGTVEGEVNGVKIVATPVWSAVNTRERKNDLLVKVEKLPDDISTVTRSVVGLLTAPCWVFSYPVNNARNGFSLTNGYFNQTSRYQFETGENLVINQRATGVDTRGFLIVDTLVSGSTPDFYKQQVVQMDPYIENFVQSGHGHVNGYGNGHFNIGSQYRIPVSWDHDITYDGDNLLPTASQEVRVEVVEIGNEKSHRDKTVAYKMSTDTIANKECPIGFTRPQGQQYCEDIDECVEFPLACSHYCTNTHGNFSCSCPAGWLINPLNRYECIDLDECATEIHTCRKGQLCLNMVGSYKCQGHCDHPGYMVSANGSCTDVDECQLGRSNCGLGETCVNSEGSYECQGTCLQGYRKSPEGSCIDIDECLEEIPCHTDQICFNLEGSHQCLCPAGFVSDGPNLPCRDVNECQVKPAVCAQGCINVPGSWFCTCNRGYILQADGKTCVAITFGKDLQLDGFVEEELSDLQNCPPGFEWSGENCEDIDECEVNKPCQYQCSNSEGGYACLCPAGYSLAADRSSCVDIDECTEGIAQCQPNDVCFNEKGSYLCIPMPCPAGYHYNHETKSCTLKCLMDGRCTEQWRRHPQTIQVQLVALPKGLPSAQDILRLTAFDNQGRQMRRTKYSLRNPPSHHLPFSIRHEQGRGVLFATQSLSQKRNYKLRVKAVSYSDWNHHVKFQSDFLVFISVSEYPF